jgi:hypothetical protein
MNKGLQLKRKDAMDRALKERVIKAFGQTTTQTATDVPKSSEPAVEQGDSAVIAVVKNGVLTDHNTTTVGNAFEGTFQNPKWTSFETPKKEVVVEFNGTITVAAAQEGGELNYDALVPLEDGCFTALGLVDTVVKQLNYRSIEEFRAYSDANVPQREIIIEIKRKINECVNEKQLSVKFQFVLSADKTTFKIQYIDKAFSEPNRVLAFVYR